MPQIRRHGELMTENYKVKEKVVVLSGGTGTPKLLYGAKFLFEKNNLTVIGNTGDDWDFYGIHVSPDVDAVLFTLSNQLDTAKWWGIKNDSFRVVEGLKHLLKEDVWFNLGDLDLSVSLFRTFLLKRGYTLTKATEIIKNKLNIPFNVFPMTDSQFATIIDTEIGKMHLEEFWVKHHGDLEVNDVTFSYDASTCYLPDVILQELCNADIIVLGPSNPISSIGPILEVPGFRDALKKSSAKKIAISPIIGKQPVSGPAGKFMQAKGYEVSPLGVAECYESLIDYLVIHTSDKTYENELKAKNVQPLIMNIIYRNWKDSLLMFYHLIDAIRKKE